MYKGIYIAASGAVLMQQQLETVTQNIANANTAGFKKDSLSFKDYLLQADPGSGPDGRAMSDYSSSKIDFSAGTAVRTGNPLDLAVEGDGLIALDGNFYTRRGDFKKNSDGYLTTFDGVKVLGEGGPILLPEDTVEVSVDLEGKVSVVQAGSDLPTEIDTIKILDFPPDAAVTKVGDSRFSISGEGVKSTSTVKQGYIETSNVNAVNEMVRMIQTEREFETYQKAIQAFDDATAKVNNELGRLS